MGEKEKKKILFESRKFQLLVQEIKKALLKKKLIQKVWEDQSMSRLEHLFERAIEHYQECHILKGK